MQVCFFRASHHSCIPIDELVFICHCNHHLYEVKIIKMIQSNCDLSETKLSTLMCNLEPQLHQQEQKDTILS